MLIENLYITNYCDKRCSSLNSITRIPTEDAYSLAKKLSQNIGTTFTSFNRFCDKDFEGYYKKRIRTEEWLYNSFIALGGKPQNAHPLYFVLHESKYLDNWFENGTQTKLFLKDINSADISFTFGDSMSMMDKPERRNPFKKESLLDLINNYNETLDQYINEIARQYGYIEVQLWNDNYCII